MDEGVWTCLIILQPFTFRIQFILFAGKKAFEIQRFDQFTPARSSPFFNFWDGHL